MFFVRKYHYFEQKDVFWDHFSIFQAYDYSRTNIAFFANVQHFAENKFFLDHFEKNRFLLISPLISKFKEMVLFSFQRKNTFLLICSKISAFRAKFRYFAITLKNSFFAYISENSSNINISLRLLWKNRFLPISLKVSTFCGKEIFFEITLKKSFFAHISVNIKIQGNGTFFRSL